jgi:RHS repeat-associated protein
VRTAEDVTSSLTYNHDGKLQSGTASGITVDLKYDPDGNRIYREVTDGATTTKRKYIVDTEGDLPVVLLEIDPDENDPNASIRKTYIYGNSQLLAQHDGFYGEDTYFYLHDRLGSVRQVIGIGATVENKYVYQPFGESFASEQAENVGNDIMFTGQYYDSEIEQYCLRARQYDPTAHRFASRDPLPGIGHRPLSLHQYLYCKNNPVNLVDPQGTFPNIPGSGSELVLRFAEAAAYRRIIIDTSVDAIIRGANVSRSMDVLCGAGNLIPQLVNATMQGHHVWPVFLGGAANGLTVEVPSQLHQAVFHNRLRENLQSVFAEYENEYGNISTWSTNGAWQEILTKPENRLMAFQVLSETSFCFDYQYGTNMTARILLKKTVGLGR